MDLLQITAYVRGLLAKLAQSGWRPIFGWGGGLMLLGALKFAYMDAPMAGVALSDGYYTGLNTALGLFLGAFVARGVEKHMQNRSEAAPYVAPTGGAVNNAAISG